MTVRIHTNITTAMLNPETIEISMLIQRYYLSLSLTYTIMLYGQLKIKDEIGSKSEYIGTCKYSIQAAVA
jgi:hypothetical protein